LKLGLGVMGLKRKEFWSMTMREFWAIHDSKFAHIEERINQDDLKELMEKHPDGKH